MDTPSVPQVDKTEEHERAAKAVLVVVLMRINSSKFAKKEMIGMQ